MKKADIAIIACMVGVGVITAAIYLPRVFDYSKSRQEYSSLRQEYVSEEVTLSSESVPESNEISVLSKESSPESQAESSESSESVKSTESATSTDEPVTEDDYDDGYLDAVTTAADKTFPNTKYLDDEKDFEKVLEDIVVDKKLLKKLKKISVNHKELLDKNEDYIGWVYVPDTTISYPVVKSKDNNDYLHKSFEKSSSNGGCVFRDANCEAMNEEHIVLYGHNMRDGSMFAPLNSYVTNEEFVKEHPVFWFFSKDRIYLYQIFSAHKTKPSDRDIFGAQATDYSTRQKWMDAVKKMKENSIFESDVEIKYGDQVMTLSTCTPERVDRAVVHGKLIAYSGKK